MNCLRDANVTLRWLMLHKNCKNKKFKDVIEPLDQPTKDARMKDIVTLLLHLSKYEQQLKGIFTNLVNQKTQIW